VGFRRETAGVTELLRTLADRLAPAHTALIVVDMQNDFCAPGGYVANLGRDVSACGAIVPAVNALVAGARAHGVPVIWLMAEYEDADVPVPMLAKKMEMGVRAISCARGTWGAEAFGVAPLPDEPVVVKHCYSGFVGTDLQARLAARNIATLVFAGVQTNVCVDSTLRDGHSLGHYIVVAGDCVASHMPAAHAATLDNVRFLFGDVADGAAIVSAWRTAAALTSSA
jgi:ureidoacrylate peracid hydrolase